MPSYFRHPGRGWRDMWDLNPLKPLGCLWWAVTGRRANCLTHYVPDAYAQEGLLAPFSLPTSPGLSSTLCMRGLPDPRAVSGRTGWLALRLREWGDIRPHSPPRSAHDGWARKWVQAAYRCLSPLSIWVRGTVLEADLRRRGGRYCSQWRPASGPSSGPGLSGSTPIAGFGYLRVRPRPDVDGGMVRGEVWRAWIASSLEGRRIGPRPSTFPPTNVEWKCGIVPQADPLTGPRSWEVCTPPCPASLLLTCRPSGSAGPFRLLLNGHDSLGEGGDSLQHCLLPSMLRTSMLGNNKLIIPSFVTKTRCWSAQAGQISGVCWTVSWSSSQW